MKENAIPKELERYFVNDADWYIFHKSKLAGHLQAVTLDDMKCDKILLCELGRSTFFIPINLVLNNKSLCLSEHIYCLSSKYDSEIFKIDCKQASSICTKVQKKYNDDVTDMNLALFDEIMGFALDYVNREYKNELL